jgi:hypothetical protein
MTYAIAILKDQLELTGAKLSKSQQELKEPTQWDKSLLDEIGAHRYKALLIGHTIDLERTVEHLQQAIRILEVIDEVIPVEQV